MVLFGLLLQSVVDCNWSGVVARLWSVDAKANLVVYKGHNYPVWDCDYSPLGYYFATASHDRTARLWSTDRIFPLRIYAGHLSDVDVCKVGMRHQGHHYAKIATHQRLDTCYSV
jgi:WD40 repeat protein